MSCYSALSAVPLYPSEPYYWPHILCTQGTLVPLWAVQQCVPSQLQKTLVNSVLPIPFQVYCLLDGDLTKAKVGYKVQSPTPILPLDCISVLSFPFPLHSTIALYSTLCTEQSQSNREWLETPKNAFLEQSLAKLDNHTMESQYTL